ncbi:chemotaxis protein MotB [Ferrimonas sediminum]|uniref:Chemotaxis protein MotB n=1 Tax=Ferrimonas sediminum TaxID=718193 RepID=A0A1G9A1P5_9GAMM|nr:flagellar motor protein MotB [Ferrimonas sediminum]SDK20515.1 chemotaxis protein MotB [Ferrimonas sediminum]
MIVKKGKKRKHGGSHGGAWKVAFADFTLAMMCFFMVMWLMQIADQQERKAIVQQLNGPPIEQGANPLATSVNSSIIDFEGRPSVDKAAVPATGTGPEQAGVAMFNNIPEGEVDSLAGKGDELNAMVPGSSDTQIQLQTLAQKVRDVTQNSEIAKHVDFDMTPQGLRIVIQDSSDQFMFKRGRNQMEPYFEDLMLSLAEILTPVKNRFIVSGHTDSAPFAGNRKTNWELSSMRALEARRALVIGGVDAGRVLQVAGYADQMLFDEADPMAARNRRIELFILSDEGEQTLFDQHGLSGQQMQQARSRAESNRSRLRYND